MSRNNPLVTAIIPSYNREKVLGQAVDSVLGQNYSPLELLVVDNGSTDGTARLLGGYGKSLSVIKVPERGVSRARNAGIRAASGEYICFLDSDDLWLPGKIKKQAELLLSYPSCKVCYTDEIWIRRGVRVNQCRRHRKYSGDIFERTLPLCIISPSSVMMHRGVFDEIGLFDESLPACEDYDMWLRITARYFVSFIPEPLITKTGGHPDQLSSRFWGMDRFRLISLVKLMGNPDVNAYKKRLAFAELERKSKVLANGAKKRGKMVEAGFYENLPKAYSHVV